MSQNQQPTNQPSTFRDAAGRTWSIRLTLGLIETVLDETTVDLIPDGCDVTNLTSLLFDPRKLSRVLWSCVATQADGTTVQEFRDAMDGDALLQGWNALIEAVLFFTRSRSEPLAAAIEEAIETAMKIIEQGTATAISVMRSEQTDKLIADSVADAGRQMHAGMASALAGSVTN
jgi:hypothetical protein